MAMKVADFYHYDELRQKIAALKQVHEEKDRAAVARAKRMRWTKSDDPARRRPSDGFSSYGFSSSPSSRHGSKPFQDFDPPPTIARPELVQAVPAIERTGLVSVAPPSGTTTWDSELALTESSPSGTKRKLADLELEDPQLETQQPPVQSKLSVCHSQLC
jgi:hypothetical protein